VKGALSLGLGSYPVRKSRAVWILNENKRGEIDLLIGRHSLRAAAIRLELVGGNAQVLRQSRWCDLGFHENMLEEPSHVREATLTGGHCSRGLLEDIRWACDQRRRVEHLLNVAERKALGPCPSLEP
jgi:hypothetical protein